MNNYLLTLIVIALFSHNASADVNASTLTQEKVIDFCMDEPLMHEHLASSMFYLTPKGIYQEEEQLLLKIPKDQEAFHKITCFGDKIFLLQNDHVYSFDLTTKSLSNANQYNLSNTTNNPVFVKDIVNAYDASSGPFVVLSYIKYRTHLSELFINLYSYTPWDKNLFTHNSINSEYLCPAYTTRDIRMCLKQVRYEGLVKDNDIYYDIYSTQGKRVAFTLHMDSYMLNNTTLDTMKHSTPKIALDNHHEKFIYFTEIRKLPHSFRYFQFFLSHKKNKSCIQYLWKKQVNTLLCHDSKITKYTLRNVNKKNVSNIRLCYLDTQQRLKCIYLHWSNTMKQMVIH